MNRFLPNLVYALILFHRFLPVFSPPHFHIFVLITPLNVSGFSPDLVCALILWRSGLVLQMGKFFQFLTELSANHEIVVGYYCFMHLFCSEYTCVSKKVCKLGIIEAITKTRLYNFDPLKPHFYKVKLGFTGVYIIFHISAQKHRLWVLVRTASARRF